jgi:hypothetical protein
LPGFEQAIPGVVETVPVCINQIRA